MEWIKIDKDNKPKEKGKYICFVPDCKHYYKHRAEYYWDGKNFIDDQPLLGNGRVVGVTHFLIITDPEN